MLKSLRKKGVAKKVIWVVAIIIIISFGFMGTAYLITGNNKTGYAGHIFGKKISLEDFNKAYQNTRIQAIRQHGENLAKIAHLLNLEAQTWDRIILLHEAKRRNIKIPDDQVVKIIQEDKSFERDNKFDMLLYNAILRNLGIRPRDYEENIRNNLKIAELYKQTTSSAILSEQDIFREYQNRNEKIQISYVFVSPDPFKEGLTVGTSEVEQYYNNRKSDFLMPPAVNIQYIQMPFPQTPEPTENSGDVTTDDPSSAEALKELKETVKDKAYSIFQELLVNPNMEEVAKTNNLATATSGFFSMEQPDLSLGWSYDLLNKIFQMEEGDINEPFETSDGIIIVQLKEERDAFIPEFAEAKEKAEKKVIEQKAQAIAKEKTAEYLDAIQNELNKSKLKDFPKAAKALELEIHQTPIFSRGQYLPKIGISKEFQEAAFTLNDDKTVSKVVETSTGYCILHLDNYIPADKDEYMKVKDSLKEALLEEKQDSVFGDFVTQLRMKAAFVDNLANLRKRGE